MLGFRKDGILFKAIIFLWEKNRLREKLMMENV